ncbi:MAG: hypothetical protein ACP5N9_06600 [Candidatus Bilamarchaeum sp.]|jgi:hypothetical protein
MVKITLSDLTGNSAGRTPHQRGFRASEIRTPVPKQITRSEAITKLTDAGLNTTLVAKMALPESVWCLESSEALVISDENPTQVDRIKTAITRGETVSGLYIKIDWTRSVTELTVAIGTSGLFMKGQMTGTILELLDSHIDEGKRGVFSV